MTRIGWFWLLFVIPVGAFEIPAGLDHGRYAALLQKYVGDSGLVDYAAWKRSPADQRALRDYVSQFAAPEPVAAGPARAAALINAYNALTILWILDHYPVASIRDTDEPWKAKRWPVGGREVSLDEIEHETLRPLLGYRVHAVLVCAAKSCPPLWNRAFQAEDLDAQLDARMKAWLARPDLNRFLPDKNRVVLSQIFNWFRDDFDQAGGLRVVLAKYAPGEFAEFLKRRYEVSYLSYDWSLNEQK
jgi:hypothetical protein